MIKFDLVDFFDIQTQEDYKAQSWSNCKQLCISYL